jgi:YD repeat-containing protein
MFTCYKYDEAGNELAQIDALNRTNIYAYDSQGRRIRHALPGGQVEGAAFDLGGNLVYQTNFNGRVITNQYDELNRLTNQISVNGDQARYVYDPATGQRVRMTDGSGVTAYGYDRRDRLVLKTVNWNQGPGVSLNYGYDANGNVMNLWSSTASGVNLAYRYDPLNRLTVATVISKRCAIMSI